MIVEHRHDKIVINLDRFFKHITELRTAVDSDGTLDEVTLCNEINAFRRALKLYFFEDNRIAR
jgi:hypothetical protein